MRCQVPMHQQRANSGTAFTIAEVMIASTIFFVSVFAILGVLSQGLNSARLLKRDGPTAGMVAAEYFAAASTNRVEEGSDLGDFGEFYRGYKWARETVLLTNGMFRIDIVVTRDGAVNSTLTTFLYDAKSGSGVRR